MSNGKCQYTDPKIGITTNKKAHQYLAENNVDRTSYLPESIPSLMASLYKLPNGEYLLISTWPEPDYPALFFKRIEDFRACCTADFFPIGEENMTWLEIHMPDMRGWLETDSFYLDPLRDVLKMKVPFETMEDCEAGFWKISALLNNRKLTLKEKRGLADCYVLAFAQYMVRFENYEWTLDRSYEVYNPYYMIDLISKKTQRNISLTGRFLVNIKYSRRNKTSFSDFYADVKGLFEW